MKKLLSIFAISALGGTISTVMAGPPPCGDGINNLYIWDGGGVNNSWNTAANWSPDGIPDCDDDVRFNSTSTKQCHITSSVQVRDFSVLGSWSGRIFLRGTSALSLRNMLMQGGMVLGNDTNGLFRANDVFMGFNAFLNVQSALITGTLTLNNAVFAVRYMGYLDVQNLTLNNFAKLTGPDGFQDAGVGPKSGITYIRGNLTRQPLGSFQHEFGLVRFCGETNGTINTNNTLFTLWNIEIDKKRDGAGDTTAPSHLYTNPTTNDRIFALNRLSLMEVTLTGWAVDDWVAGGDSVIVENSMANNDNSHWFSNSGHATLAFLGSGNGTFFHKTLLSGTYNVRVEKGSSLDTVLIDGLQDIGSSGETVHIAKGRLTYDGSGTSHLRASVNSGLHVLADGQLIAPDDDTLYFAGCWNFANTNSFNPQNGVLHLNGTGNRLSFHHNEDTVYFNEVVITTTNGGSQSVFNWSSQLDVIYVRGDFKILSADAYLSNLQVFVEGDFTSAQTTANAAVKLTTKLVFKGGNNQTVTLSSASKDAYRQLVELEKTGGSVTLASDMDARAMRFTSGVLNDTGFMLTVLVPNMIYGGNSLSYINGPVTVAHGGSIWPSDVKVPVGKGSSYNPIHIRNATTSNTYTIEYFNTGYSGTNTVNTPLDQVSTSEYWQVDRVAGATAYNVSLPTTNAPGGWSATDIRVAGNDGSGWNDLGPAGGASGGLVTSTTGTTSSTRYFTLGLDNISQVMLLKDGVSGNEVQTNFGLPGTKESYVTVKPVMNLYPNPALNQFTVNLDHVTSGTISVSDLNGRILYTGDALRSGTIDCSTWSPGMYIVRFSDGINSIARCVSKTY